MRKISVDSETDALIIVDVQNDFCPGGAAGVPYGDEVVPSHQPALRASLAVGGNHGLASRRCLLLPSSPVEPIAPTLPAANSRSGVARVRCPQGAADHHQGRNPIKRRIRGFHGTNLAKILRDKGVHRVVVCGIATDYCVRATAHDALHEGFEVLVLEDAIRGVEVHPGDCQRATAELRQAGAEMIVSSDLSFD